jgi:hypothetical protein
VVVSRGAESPCRELCSFSLPAYGAAVSDSSTAVSQPGGRPSGRPASPGPPAPCPFGDGLIPSLVGLHRESSDIRSWFTCPPQGPAGAAFASVLCLAGQLHVRPGAALPVAETESAMAAELHSLPVLFTQRSASMPSILRDAVITSTEAP